MEVLTKNKMEVRVTFLILLQRGRTAINGKMQGQEMLQTRTSALENLYEAKFKIKGAVQKNDASNTNVQKNVSISETTVANTDKNESIILNINENRKHLVNENKGKEETSRKFEDPKILISL